MGRLRTRSLRLRQPAAAPPVQGRQLSAPRPRVRPSIHPAVDTLTATATQHGTRRCLWKYHAQDDARCPDTKCARRCVDVSSVWQYYSRTCIVVITDTTKIN